MVLYLIFIQRQECKEKIDEKTTVDGVVSFADLKNGKNALFKGNHSQVAIKR